MITFKQLESGTPPDIEVTTDDQRAELAALDDCFRSAGYEDSESYKHLTDATPDPETGVATFIVPGDEAGEIGDILYDDEGVLQDADGRTLDDWLEEQNRRLIEKREQEAQ